MESSLGLMAVLAVSGSVVFLAHQVNKRLLTDFMKRIEDELNGSEKFRVIKKKVRFAGDVKEPSSNNYKYGTRKGSMMRKETMPLNRLFLYKGVIEYKTLKGQYNC